jgi:superfamily II DNA or RNA helicase
MQNLPPFDSNPTSGGSLPEAGVREGGGPQIRVGDPVRIRRQRWRVASLRAYDRCAVVTLTGIGAHNIGVERRVLTPFDSVERLERPARLRMVRMRRWRRLCRALVAEQGPTSMLRTALRARIDLLPYQLEPALAVIRGLGTRVLIADEVGLGKTIQAGLILSELAARGAADRALVLAPAGLREQWAGELRDRFGVEATLVDMREARRRASELPVGVNPWSTVPFAIASVDYVKRPEVRPAALACRWDVVIVDEAHGIAPHTERHDAVASLCALAPHVVLLTATPHSGDDEGFASLCGLGGHAGDRLLAFRRSRQDAALGSRRRIHRLQVRSSRDELRMHAVLARFTHAVRAEHGDRDRDIWLVLTTLHKRALSSAYALEQSVLRRLARLDPPPEAEQQLGLPLDEGGDLDSSDEPPAWMVPVLHDPAHERRLLLDLASAAAAAARRETKVRTVARLVARLIGRDERGIVFTEYRDTLLRLRNSLPFACAVLHGGLTRGERRLALEQFASGRHPILLATDAAGEGLNLHHHCRVVVNLELPWNPTRLEQRAGRVDRIGQRRTVHAFHLIASDTAELRILERLKWRIARARHAIDAADPLGSSTGEEEHLVSRLVIGGETVASLLPASDAKPSSGQEERLRIIRLEDEAALEHARLVWGRSFLDRNGQDPVVEPAAETAAAIARRRRLRSTLGSHLLVIIRSRFEDGVGRTVASHLTALTISVSPRILRRTLAEGITAVLRDLSPAAMAALDPSCAAWNADSKHHHRSFWQTRLAREHAVATARCALVSPGFQPGLFDRRAERALQTGNDRREAMSDEVVRHLSAMEHAAVIEAKEPGVILVLVP